MERLDEPRAGTRTPRPPARRAPRAPPAGTDARCCRRRRRRGPAARRQDAIMPGGRGLAVRPGHGQVRDVAQPGAQLQLAPDAGSRVSRAQARIGASGGTPGLGHDERRALQVRRVVPAGRDLHAELRAAAASASSASGGRASLTSTSAPSPTSTTRGGGSGDARARPRPPAGPRTRPLIRGPRGDEVHVEQPEPHRDAEPGDDPEPHDHGELGPAGQLEVVVDRRHAEDPSAEPAERDHLQDHRHRLDHEQPAEDRSAAAACWS